MTWPTYFLRCPARQSKTIVSKSELLLSRLAPCVHYAHSPVRRVLEPRFHPIDRSKGLPSGSAPQDAWNRALNWIDTDKFDSQFTNLRTPTHDSLASQMPKIKRHAAIHTTVFEFFSDGERDRRAGAFVILLSSWIVLTANGASS